MLFEGGKTRFLDRKNIGQCSFEIDGINDAGVVVGIHAYRGFVRYPDGLELTVNPLSTRPEWNGTRVGAIDNEGDIIGGTPRPVYGPDLNDYVIHAFLATADRGRVHNMRDLGALPGFPDTYATAIAEDGTVVGYSGTNSGPKWTRVTGPSHAWMWYRGHMTDIGAAGPFNRPARRLAPAVRARSTAPASLSGPAVLKGGSFRFVWCRIAAAQCACFSCRYPVASKVHCGADPG